MDIFQKLQALGADVDGALERLCDDKDLYIELLGELLEDFQTYEVKSFLDAGDYETATLNAHSLKGVTGNLGLTSLYEQYKKINDFLKMGDAEAAEAVLEATLLLQAKYIEAIRG